MGDDNYDTYIMFAGVYSSVDAAEMDYQAVNVRCVGDRRRRHPGGLAAGRAHGGLAALVISVVLVLISKRALHADRRDRRLRITARALVSRWATRFTGADLTGADFTGASADQCDGPVPWPRIDRAGRAARRICGRRRHRSPAGVAVRRGRSGCRLSSREARNSDRAGRPVRVRPRDGGVADENRRRSHRAGVTAGMPARSRVR